VYLEGWISDPSWQKALIWGAALLLSLPFLIAAYRKLKALSMLLAEMSVKPEMAGRHTQRVRRVIAELIPILSLLVIFLLLSALSASILPTNKLLVLIAVVTAGQWRRCCGAGSSAFIRACKWPCWKPWIITRTRRSIERMPARGLGCTAAPLSLAKSWLSFPARRPAPSATPIPMFLRLPVLLRRTTSTTVPSSSTQTQLFNDLFHDLNPHTLMARFYMTRFIQ
jgi:hypothetical protein